MSETVLIRGGGDLATGVALRLFRAGFPIIISELPRPLAVRRTVAFAEAIYAGSIEVEKVCGQRIEDPGEASDLITRGKIPVLVDPEASLIKDASTSDLNIICVVDARLTKRPPESLSFSGNQNAQGMSLRGGQHSPMIIGLGPGFIAGLNCHAVVETVRGHTMGRVYWKGGALPDTNQPEGDPRRVLRAPAAGRFIARIEIAQHVESGQMLAEVEDQHGSMHEIKSPFSGIVRGMLHSGLDVQAGLKVGDVDQRDDPKLCELVSDKSLAVGGGVLEAILGFHAAVTDSRG